MLEEYLQSNLYPGLEAKQLHETGFTLPVLAKYGINAQCYGFIDNIIYNSDGSLSIIDYKTGHVPDSLPKGYKYQLPYISWRQKKCLTCLSKVQSCTFCAVV